MKNSQWNLGQKFLQTNTPLISSKMMDRHSVISTCLFQFQDLDILVPGSIWKHPKLMVKIQLLHMKWFRKCYLAAGTFLLIFYSKLKSCVSNLTLKCTHTNLGRKQFYLASILWTNKDAITDAKFLTFQKQKKNRCHNSDDLYRNRRKKCYLFLMLNCIFTQVMAE